MDKYIKIDVPVSTNAKWYKEMQNAFKDIKVEWKIAGFHLTAAYVKLGPQGVSMLDIANKILTGQKAPTVCFDKLDVFTTPSGFKHIINLTCSCPTDELMAVVQPLRDALRDAGFQMTTDFKLHVTLGEVKCYNANLETLKSLAAKVVMPSFNLTLHRAELKSMGDRKCLGAWEFK